MYAEKNYRTKKALKQAVADGELVTLWNPGPFGDPPRNGQTTVEGPQYPEPHRWYAQVTVEDGAVVKVR